MSVTMTHNAVTLSAECADEFDGIIQRLFDLMKQSLDRGAKLTDGSKVAFGWTEFRVTLVDGVLILQEPDFDDDPDAAFRDNLDFSLSGYRRQQLLIDTLGLGRWEPMLFSDTVFVERGAIATPAIVARRLTDPQGRYCWLACLETTARSKEVITLERLDSSFEQIPVWHMYDVRPALFDILALPQGFQARIHDNRIVEVANDDGDRWTLQ
jgi:hypothetical protein